MAGRLIEPFMTYLDANGDPLAGGLLQFNEAGSPSTPKTTYSDEALATANANPIVLDSAGRAAVDVFGSGDYRLIVKNSSGVEQDTFDPIYGLAGDSELVEYLAPFTGSEARTVEAKLADWISVLDFGATGDNTTRKLSASTVAGKVALGFDGSTLLRDMDVEDTEDWLGIQLAINAANAAGGGTVLIPNGTYITRRGLKMFSNVHVVGESVDGVIIKNTYAETGDTWKELHRRDIFYFGLNQPSGTDQAYANPMTSYTTDASAIRKGQNFVTLGTAAEAGNFSSGDIVFVRSAAEYSTSPAIAEQSFINKIVHADASTGILYLQYGILADIAGSTSNRVYKDGTGQVDWAGNEPWYMCENSSIRNMTFSEGKRITAESGFLNCEFENLVADGMRTTIQSGGYYSTVKNMWGRNLTGYRSLENKGGGQYVHYENVHLESEANDTTVAPMVEVGEGSMYTSFKNCSFHGRAAVTTRRQQIFACQSSPYLSFEHVRMSSEDAYEVVLFNPTFANEEITLKDVYIHAQTNTTFRQLRAEGDCVLEVDGLYLSADNGILASDSVKLTNPISSSLANVQFDNTPAVITDTTTSMSPIRGIMGANATDLANTAHWVNTVYKKEGRLVWDVTNGQLLYPSGTGVSDNWVSLDNYLGTYYGTGSPEGVVTAPVGATYQRSDGGAGTTFYTKESGTGNTGWAAALTSGVNQLTRHGTEHTGITSGSTLDWTAIPAGVNQITVVVSDHSASTAATLDVQIGDSGGLETTGYNGRTREGTGGSDWSTYANITHGTAGGDIVNGTIRMWRGAGNKWHIDGDATTETGTFHEASGWKELSGELTQVRVKVSAGTFDGGTEADYILYYQ